MAGKRDLDDVLDEVSPNRRDFLRRIVTAAAFIGPIVSSFSMNELTTRPAMAGFSNMTS
jgi:hypothetical protein